MWLPKNIFDSSNLIVRLLTPSFSTLYLRQFFKLPGGRLSKTYIKPDHWTRKPIFVWKIIIFLAKPLSLGLCFLISRVMFLNYFNSHHHVIQNTYTPFVKLLLRQILLSYIKKEKNCSTRYIILFTCWWKYCFT